jgi:hypothetical protein
MKKITIDKYVAIDGEQFDTEEECAEHENRLDKFAIIRDIPVVFVNHDEVFPSGGCNDQLVLFNIKTSVHAHLLIAWCNENGIAVDVQEKYIVGRVCVIADAYTGTENPTIDDIQTSYLYGRLETLNQYIGNLSRSILAYANLFEEENAK